jgi:hypothetical protein
VARFLFRKLNEILDLVRLAHGGSAGLGNAPQSTANEEQNSGNGAGATTTGLDENPTGPPVLAYPQGQEVQGADFFSAAIDRVVTRLTPEEVRVMNTLLNQGDPKVRDPGVLVATLEHVVHKIMGQHSTGFWGSIV